MKIWNSHVSKIDRMMPFCNLFIKLPLYYVTGQDTPTIRGNRGRTWGNSLYRENMALWCGCSIPAVEWLQTISSGHCVVSTQWSSWFVNERVGDGFS